MRRRWGVAWKLTNSEFAELVRRSTTLRSVAQALGLKYSGNGYLAVRNRIQAEKLDTSHFVARPSKPLSEVAVEHSTYKRANLKAQILKKKLIPYVCAICKMDPIWNGKPLVLRLDHANGVNDDHRLMNLRFVCPNCDSQLPTFAARNIRKSQVV